MRQVLLIRDPFPPGRNATYGRLRTDNGFECETMERLHDGDHPCILPGTYPASMKPHPIQGKRYELAGVKDRTAILIHPANWVFQLQGCIALGRAIMDLEVAADVASKFGLKPGKMLGLSSSRDAVAGFEADLEGADFELTIKEG
jgi:hypothetical protein